VGILQRARAGHRAALPPETSFPGVFAMGDVRRKRVVAAIGEGAALGLSVAAARTRFPSFMPRADRLIAPLRTVNAGS
jgi:hypothetical protein